MRRKKKSLEKERPVCLVCHQLQSNSIYQDPYTFRYTGKRVGGEGVGGDSNTGGRDYGVKIREQSPVMLLVSTRGGLNSGVTSKQPSSFHSATYHTYTTDSNNRILMQRNTSFCVTMFSPII
jgi:hypothetical protein